MLFFHFRKYQQHKKLSPKWDFSFATERIHKKCTFWMKYHVVSSPIVKVVILTISNLTLAKQTRKWMLQFKVIKKPIFQRHMIPPLIFEKLLSTSTPFLFFLSSLWWWEGKKKFPGTYVSCSRCKITFSHISTANFKKVPVYLLLWKCTFWLVPVSSNLKEIAPCAYLEYLRILPAAICQQKFSR